MDAPNSGPPPGVNAGEVSEPEYGCGEVQPFFGCLVHRVRVCGRGQYRSENRKNAK